LRGSFVLHTYDATFLLGGYLKHNCPNLSEHLGDNQQGIACFSIWPRYQGQYDWDTEEIATRKVGTQ
jgi:hypothetical protein